MQLDDDATPAEREAWAWRALMCALGGYSSTYTLLRYPEREELKTFAAAYRSLSSGPTTRVGGWLLHALAHWARVEEELNEAWSADKYDETFPHGMNFRRYLGAWLASVGRPQLKMTDADLEAVHEATGVAMLPHPLMGPGKSRFDR